MDEKILGAFLVGVVYPAMIAVTGLIFALLVHRSNPYKNSSKKSFEHRVRR